MGSAHPYAVGGSHRHIPEIQQNLTLSSGQPVTLSLTPVLVPMSRGILATVSATRKGAHTVSEIHQILQDTYANEPFVRVREIGAFPRTADVVGSNTVSLGVAVDEAVNRVIVVAAIDNLVKGTAGAAIQSMNLALGLDETWGLTANGVAP
jgi:N-acetyl-gamma-glutamyl-phosphate reductase